MALLKKDKIKKKIELVKLISDSYAVIAWDYSKLSSEQITKVKRLIKQADGKDLVCKNRIIKLAFNDLNKHEIQKDLIGPTSFLFINKKELGALTELFKYLKKLNNKNLRLKAAYIDNEYFSKEQINELASLPGKDDLLSILISVLQGNMRNLAVVLSQVAQQKTE